MDNLKFVNALINATRRRRLQWAEPEKSLSWIDYKVRANAEEVYFVNLEGYLVVSQMGGPAGDTPSLTLLDWNLEEIYTFDLENLLERDDGFFSAPHELTPGSEAALEQLFQLVRQYVQSASVGV